MKLTMVFLLRIYSLIYGLFLQMFTANATIIHSRKIQSYTCISDQNASIIKDYVEDVKMRNVEDVGMYANTLYS